MEKKDSFQDDTKIKNLVSELLDKKINAIFEEFPFDTLGLAGIDLLEITVGIKDICDKDIFALVNGDPAADRGNLVSSYEYVLTAYSSVQAVIYYRISNYFYNYSRIDEDIRNLIARQICEESKIQTQIEINPAAKIGVPFVIDHGTNTVIGQTAEIGKNCYILNCVTLGAPGISQSDISECDKKKRHPTLGDNIVIGDNVQIGAHVGIYGPVKIGDNVRINPCCLIGNDIPPNYFVTVSNQIQACGIQSNNRKHLQYKITIYGIVPVDEGKLDIFGESLSNSNVYFIDDHYKKIEDFRVQIVENTDKKLSIIVFADEIIKSTSKYEKTAKLVIRSGENEAIIMKSPGLKKAIKSIISKPRGG